MWSEIFYPYFANWFQRIGKQQISTFAGLQVRIESTSSLLLRNLKNAIEAESDDVTNFFWFACIHNHGHNNQNVYFISNKMSFEIQCWKQHNWEWECLQLHLRCAVICGVGRKTEAQVEPQKCMILTMVLLLCVFKTQVAEHYLLT